MGTPRVPLWMWAPNRGHLNEKPPPSLEPFTYTTGSNIIPIPLDAHGHVRQSFFHTRQQGALVLIEDIQR